MQKKTTILEICSYLYFFFGAENAMYLELQGAATIVYVATCPELKGETGKYLADCAEKQPSNHACNKELQKKLWKWCEDFVAARLGTYSEQK
jgi:hypothetical protein